jgi:hypothetical protein
MTEFSKAGTAINKMNYSGVSADLKRATADIRRFYTATFFSFGLTIPK